MAKRRISAPRPSAHEAAHATPVDILHRPVIRARLSQIWRAVNQKDVSLRLEIARAMKEKPKFDAQEKGLVAQAISAMARRGALLDTLLVNAPLPQRASVALYMDGVLAPGPLVDAYGEAWVNQLNDALDKTMQAGSPRQRASVIGGVPAWLTLAIFEAVDEPSDLIEALADVPPQVVRVNTLKTDRDSLLDELHDADVKAFPHDIVYDAIVFDPPIDIYKLPAFKDGLFEVQDAGSQLIAEAVAPPPGGFVVDYCAGAGGKTLALSAALGNKGRLVASDVAGFRLDDLKQRARRAGAHNVQIVQLPKDAADGDPLEKHHGKVDRVLVDAPCSGVGVLRRRPETRWRLTEDTLERLPPQQSAILDTAAKLVKKGGRLIYATCTVLPAENEAQVEAFLERHPDFVRMSLAEIWGKARAEHLTNDKGALDVRPDRHDTDGFYAAVLRRKKK